MAGADINLTNWPNPERPGVPMFPEQDGFHIIGRLAWKWHAASELWDGVANPDEFGTFYYIGPCLTPTQIAEMLAGVRERCLTIVIDEQWNFPSDPSIQTPEAAVAFRACQRIIDEIRNLGAAP